MQIQKTDYVEEAIKKALDDPKWFFDEILGFPALDWQLEAINAVFDLRREETQFNHDKKPRITIRSCHGTGKTQFLAMLIHIWNFTTYGKIAATAPKQNQLTKRLMPRYRGAYKKAIKSYQGLIETFGQEIVVGGDKDWGAVLETAAEPESLAGYHDKPQLFVVDEASSKRLDPMYPVIEGAITTPGSCIVEIGNPTRMSGEFYNHHNASNCRDLYYRMHIKPQDARELISEQWQESMKIKYGEKSPIYLIRVLGEFAAFDEAILVNLEDFENALDSDHVRDGSLSFKRISIDVADGGADATVITVAEHFASFTEILQQKSFYFPPSQSPIMAAKAAIRLSEAYNFGESDDFVVDSMGVGSGTAGYLIDKKYTVIRHVGGEASSNPAYRNRRVQNYICLYEHFRDHKIKINTSKLDDEEKLRAHLFSIKRTSGDSDKVEDIATKDSIKKEGLESPDYADSLSMQFWNRSTGVNIDYSVIQTFGQLESASYD